MDIELSLKFIHLTGLNNIKIVMSKKRKIILICASVFVILFISITVTVCHIVTKIRKEIEEEVAMEDAVHQKIEQYYKQGNETADLNELLDFDWDEGYIFSCNVDEELLIEVIGEKYNQVHAYLDKSDMSLYWCFFNEEELIYGEYIESSLLGKIRLEAYEERYTYIKKITNEDAIIYIID